MNTDVRMSMCDICQQESQVRSKLVHTSPSIHDSAPHVHVREFLHDVIHTYIVQQGTITRANSQFLRNSFACNKLGVPSGPSLPAQ